MVQMIDIMQFAWGQSTRSRMCYDSEYALSPFTGSYVLSKEARRADTTPAGVDRPRFLANW